MIDFFFIPFKIQISETIDVITTAANSGYRHFDTSEVYENTAQLGEGIRKVLLLGKVKRKDLFITAKVNILVVLFEADCDPFSLK